MDYYPRYAQPFTLREAICLDVEIITEEISRLQNSLTKLNDTQAQLNEYIQQTKASGQDADAEIVQAAKDNVAVIGSQEERISILTMALAEKGIDTSGGHYDIPQPAASTHQPEEASQEEGALQEEGDDGVYL